MDTYASKTWRYNMSYPISNTQQHIQQLIHEQIHSAFNQKPNIARTLHGQRRIYQGCLERRTSLFPSSKAGGSVTLESFLELAYAVQLESHPTVESYRTQALKIPIGQNQELYPDFLIRTQKGNFEVHEVKPSIQHLSLESLQRFERLASILASINIPFKLVDANTLPQRQSLTKLLHLYSRGHLQNWTSLQIELAQDLLIRYELDDLEQAYSILEKDQLSPQLADYLLFHQIIQIKNAKNNHLMLGVDL